MHNLYATHGYIPTVSVQICEECNGINPRIFHLRHSFLHVNRRYYLATFEYGLLS